MSPGRAGSRALWWRNRRGRSLKPFQTSSLRTPKQSVRSDPCQNIWPLIRFVLSLKFKQLPCEVGSLVAVRISLLQSEAHLCWECHCPGGMADFGGVSMTACSLPSTAIAAQSLQPGLSAFDCFNTQSVSQSFIMSPSHGRVRKLLIVHTERLG